MAPRSMSVLGLFTCAIALGTAAPLAAQATEVPRGNFSILRFSPAPGPRNYFQTEGASTPGHLTGSAGLTLDYAHAPLVLWNAACRAGESCDVRGERAELVQYTAAAHITGSIALFDRVQIGAVVPLVITDGEGFDFAYMGDPVSLAGGLAFSVADPRMTVKGNLFADPDSGLSLGASAFVTFPTGNAIAESRYLGDELPTFGGHAIAELVHSGFRVAANVGGTWREDAQLFSTHIGPQLTYAAAVGYDITSLASVFGEVVGASTFTAQVDEHAVEWRVGGRLRAGDFEFNLGGGSGVVFGAGTPLFRVIGGLTWAPIVLDSDRDGVLDGPDACPSEAEDRDGYEDEDGCPELDNDGDGRADVDDPCPTEAEDADGNDDADGCPDTDNDGDGVADGYDSCPSEPEDRDGDRDTDGCPDADRDRDGIADDVDRCPEAEEDFDGFADEDGCAEEDVDNDGRPDTEDQCPEQAEDADGFEDEDGCPEEGSPPVAPTRPRRR